MPASRKNKPSDTGTRGPKGARNKPPATIEGHPPTDASRRRQGTAIEPAPPVAGLLRKAYAIEGRIVTLVDQSGFEALTRMAGSTQFDFNNASFANVLNAAITDNIAGELLHDRLVAVSTAMAAFKPTDEIEGMLAAQAIACHFGAMEAFGRSMLQSQPPDVASRLRKDGANLARAMVDMLDALDRKRGKAPQVVRVERVVVQDGGQAVVGNVTTAKAMG